MIWLAFFMILLVPVVIWAVLVQEENDTRRRRPPTAWLKRWWPSSVEERRHCYRYEAGVPISYKVVGGESPANETQTRDISFGGVGFLLYEKIPIGTALEITLSPQPGAQPLEVQGVIQWIREIPQNSGDPRRMFWAGVQILHNNIGTMDRLKMILEQCSHERGRGHA
ncbi:MAG: PilZ domain-containing protein [Candidatus Omnitrophica bacterium]|nr:PilZ domain-containing protein [Candidatus Omnitrophota bacterium]